ncbi:hypothetical protein DNTS_030166, partial [Danionella cerebrum]
SWCGAPVMRLQRTRAHRVYINIYKYEQKPEMQLQHASCQHTQFLRVKMLPVFALILLVFSTTQGRIVSRCELKEKLGLMKSPGDKLTIDRLFARFVCNVENTSGFNTSLITSVQKNRDQFRRQTQTPLNPIKGKPPREEDDIESMEEDHILPVHPPSPPKGSSGASSPRGRNLDSFIEIWQRAPLPKIPLVDFAGSGSELLSEVESSEEEEERDDVISWSMLGIFQLSDRVACEPASGRSLNQCGLKCSALIDDDITDDITCLQTLLGSYSKL